MAQPHLKFATDMTNPVTQNRRHFEDLAVDELIQLEPVKLTKQMIISFATQFDPFPFHLDEEAANASLLGGLAASGWQTAGLTLRMLVDAFLGEVASMGGLGFSDLKWRQPVMVNDTISGQVAIAELRRSDTHENWGIVTLDFDVRNQNDLPIMSMRLVNLIEVRDPSAPHSATGVTHDPLV